MLKPDEEAPGLLQEWWGLDSGTGLLILYMFFHFFSLTLSGMELRSN